MALWQGQGILGMVTSRARMAGAWLGKIGEGLLDWGGQRNKSTHRPNMHPDEG